MTQNMDTLTLADGTSIALDSDGHLQDLERWSPEVARKMAEHEGRELTPAHWEIIDLLRDFYTRFEMAPAMRALVKTTRQQLGEEKGTSIYLMSLFPESPARVAARLAGLPRPTNCL
ncbi:TusE/DsrC/DsvC family sulfur relay protein [Kushneria indalinina]|uniref:Sulfurtransferase n=1 Tax=Kushneria indalinina DSM 14324 TaxID=1122140 RepID=A0A3D9DZR2_9GAMM|nr:TusE/DsrC/DsvC family sulfur relay protein [Kushneria indalinina]REC96201.1 tRNA 2-thiouridine synthesizing protein E [Kushneria indalinina DSM 14324]